MGDILHSYNWFASPSGSMTWIFHGIEKEGLLEPRDIGDERIVVEDYTLAVDDEISHSSIKLERNTILVVPKPQPQTQTDYDQGGDILITFSTRIFKKVAFLDLEDRTASFSVVGPEYPTEGFLKSRGTHPRGLIYQGESINIPLSDANATRFVDFSWSTDPIDFSGTDTSINIYNVLLVDNENEIDNVLRHYMVNGTLLEDVILNLGGGVSPEPEPEAEDSDGGVDKGDKAYYYQSVQTKYNEKNGQRYSGLVSQFFARYEFNPTYRRIAFYPTTDKLGRDNKKYVLKGATGLTCRQKVGKTTSGWVENATYNINTPVYVTGDYQLDNGQYMVSAFSTNIPVFKNESDADYYIEGGDNLDDAVNADNLTDGGVVGNKKPDGDDATVTFQSFADLDKMVNYYKLTKGQMESLSDALWNSDSETVGEATKLLGGNAFNAISGCRFFPMDISTVATVGSARSIHFGKFDTGLSVPSITGNGGKFTFGSYTFQPIHNNFLDYTNVKIAIWLPYIGLNELDAHKYMGKTATLDYYVDITSGACQAVMTVGGAITDSWSGELARQVPITAEDAQSYNDGIRTSLASIKGFNIDQKATERHLAESTVKHFEKGIDAVGQGKLGSALLGAVDLYSTSQDYIDQLNKLNNQVNILNQDKVNASQNMPTMVCGVAGGFIAQRMPQSVYLFYAVNKSIEPQYTKELVGKPTGASGPVGMFNGFMSGEVVKVEGYMTDTEREMIAGLLKGGVYI